MARAELDHLFILTARGAPEAAALVELGLEEGLPNRHPGQGTANRRFFFANAYLELLWVEDEAEARSEPARRLRLWERWSRRDAGASPFGICLRGATPPFASWGYHPHYAPAPIPVALSSESVDDPLLFFIPIEGRRFEARRSLTRATLHAPAATAVMACEALELRASPEHLLELELDAGAAGQHGDLRPALPLVIRW